MADRPSQRNGSARRSHIVTVVLLSVFALGIVFLFFGLWAFVGPSTSTERKDFLQAVGGFFTGLAAIVGLYLQWKNSRATPESRPPEKEQQPEAGQREFAEAQPQTIPERGPTASGQLTEASQRQPAVEESADRISHALDQLGATYASRLKRLEARVNGIRLLERIAKDSPEDYSHIMEILIAYVRQHAAREDQGPISAGPGMTPDVKAAINVIGRLTRSYEIRESEPFDLHETSLQQADLAQANLSRVDFSSADLSRAHLSEANLSEANLEWAILDEANLSKANLEGAVLKTARLIRSNLKGAVVKGADLETAWLAQANLREADFSGALLLSAMPTRASFWKANLEGANLEAADLSQVRS